MTQTISMWHSSLSTKLMRFWLFRGTCLSGSGAFLLLFGGIFLPAWYLSTWGPLLFIISIVLIAWGLVPYRRLKQLESHPHSLSLDEKGWLHFSKKGKPLFAVALDSIEAFNYVEENNWRYGIGIVLKRGSMPQMISEDAGFDLSDYQQESLKRHGCDLFLPNFSKRSWNELNSYLVDNPD